MKVLKSWLKDYVDINISDTELADKLTLSGTEVENIVSTLSDFVVVAEIINIKKHPNADKLQLVLINDGTAEYEIVCGANNIEVGQKVPLAKVGAKMGEIEIKEVEIRGIKSKGMLCSEKELGIGDDHIGIKILDQKLEPGTKISKIFESDAVFELEITPNRGDCLSHCGVAREIAAVSKNKFIEGKITENIKKTDQLAVETKDTADCPQYYGCLIKNVKIADSPEWLQKRLIASGAKPINNVVDITNYIMLDMGQPLHAFDKNKLEGDIIIRRAADLEDLVTLDGEIRNLTRDNLVIADSKKAIALAGVMGGENSEISDDTTTIIIESAEFDRKVIRKSAKVLNLSTEASSRFERGIDGEKVKFAMQKAAKMIKEICGGETVGFAQSNILLEEQTVIEVPYQKINFLLGLSFKNNEIDKIFNFLGIEISGREAKIPFWRHDLTCWQDLAEEVVRIYGYKKIKPIPVPSTKTGHRSIYFAKEYIKDILVSSGFSEVYNYSFLSDTDIKAAKIDTKDLLEVANPIQPENKYLRNSIIPGLLKTVAKNPTFDPVLIFEIGNVFSQDSEITKIGIVSSGKMAKEAIKNAIAKLSKENKTDLSEFKTIYLERGEVERFKIKKPIVFYIEIDLESLVKNLHLDSINLSKYEKKIYYRPISKFPSITRDLAFIVNESINANDIENEIYEISELINRVELFDEFSSDKFGQDNKNVAYHIYLQHKDKTLTDKEADEIINNIVAQIENKFKAKLRVK